jgi:hypothetical protein
MDKFSRPLAGQSTLISETPWNICIICLSPGGCKKHNFRNTPVHPAENYIFGILGLKAIDWYMHGTDPRRGGGGVVGG